MNTTLPLAKAQPEVHGHRGCRGLLPENTLPGFLHALALGVDVLELDVVSSQDHQVVVAHDFWLSARLGTGPSGELINPKRERALRLYEMPYSVIRQCEVGVLPQRQFPQQQLIPTYRPLLSEVLQTVEAASRQLQRPPIKYAIELKSTSTGDGIYHPAPEQFAELVAAEIRNAGVQERTRILSFDRRILQAFRRLTPKQPVCLLVEESVSLQLLFEQLGFTPDVLGPDYRLISPQWMQQVQAAYPRLQLVPWTINTVTELQKAIDWGVTGITTDYPDKLFELLAKV